MDKAVPCASPRPAHRGRIARGRADGKADPARIPWRAAGYESRASRAGAEFRRWRSGRRSPPPPSPARSGFRADATAGWPSADPRIARPAVVIGVGLGLAHRLHGAAQPHLPAQRFPVKQGSRLHIGGELATLGALGVGVEDEALRAPFLHQHHARVRQTVGVGGGDAHGLRIVDFLLLRLLEPLPEQGEGFDSVDKVTRR